MENQGVMQPGSFLWEYGWEVLIFGVLPLLFLLTAIGFILLIDAIRKRLPDDSWLREFLSRKRNLSNPYWLRDRIDAIFTVLLFALLIAVTFLYS